MTHDITFEQDRLDRADRPPDWGDEIPFDGAVVPSGSTPDAMDAEVMSFGEWQEEYGPDVLDVALGNLEPWEREPEYHYFTDPGKPLPTDGRYTERQLEAAEKSGTRPTLWK